MLSGITYRGNENENGDIVVSPRSKYTFTCSKIHNIYCTRFKQTVDGLDGAGRFQTVYFLKLPLF